MLSTTNELIRAALKTDPTLTQSNRTSILAAIKNHGRTPENPIPTAPPEIRILRRKEAAARFGVSLRCIDNWSKSGLFPKVKLPGRVQACGFREADVIALINGQGAGEAK